MEDFAPVLWIVIVVGAMAYNGIMQARKKAEKQGHSADKHADGEAWPSWDADSAPDSVEQAPARPATTAEGTHRPARTELHTGYEGQQKACEGPDKVFGDHTTPEGQYTTCERLDTPLAGQPHTRTEDRRPGFHGDEGLRTADQTPMRAQTPELRLEQAYDGQTPGVGPDACGTAATDQSRHIAQAAPTAGYKPHDVQPDEIHDAEAPADTPHELIDGFDLRKAVVYSEILRPKFNE